MIELTKSLFVDGYQSPTYLWMKAHDPQRLSDQSAAVELRKLQGTAIGELAKQLFPDATDLSASDDELTSALQRSDVLFEAGVRHDGCYARADILRKNGNSWDLIEVKMATDAKKLHIIDLAFQKHCFTKAGIPINRCLVLCIDKAYVRDKELDVHKLFKYVDVDDKVNEVYPTIPECIAKMQSILALTACPDFHPEELLTCERSNDATEAFMQTLPDGSVFELYRTSKKEKVSLWMQGMQRMVDLPSDYKLNAKCSIQVECAKTNKAHVHEKKVEQFLQKIQEPIHFLDFETYGSPVPPFNETRPFQQLPFQYSLHIVDGSSVMHKEFLHGDDSDPRRAFLESLHRDIADVGTILVYNKAFELGVLKDLAAYFPEFASWVTSLHKRVVDLLVPFSNFDYYHPQQKGSASIKAMLPVMTDISYDNLEIKDGDNAQVQYLHSLTASSTERENIRKNLLAYCCLDTEAMIHIYNKLKKIKK